MRRLAMILLLLTAALTADCIEKKGCDKKKMVGIELTSFVTGSTILLDFSYGISRKWSVMADAGINPWILGRGLSETEKIHYGQLEEYPRIWGKLDSDLFRTMILFQYWPRSVFTGPFVSIGAGFGDKTGIDCITELGMMLDIGKGFGLATSLRMGIIEGVRKKSFDAGAIKIRFNYMF